MTRVVILTDDAATAEPRVPGFVIMGSVDAHTPPDAIVIDEMGADAAALERIRAARASAPDAKLVLLTRSRDPQWLEDASAAGIDAAVSKTLPTAALWTLVRHVVAENVFHTFARTAEPAQLRAKAAGLTDRELEILQLVASGLSNARIAAQLWVTEQTVKFHLSNTYRKLGVTSRTQASHYAYMLRLVEVPPRTAEHAA
jgi:DNA-binding NarL/FixJ family response regulator